MRRGSEGENALDLDAQLLHLVLSLVQIYVIFSMMGTSRGTKLMEAFGRTALLVTLYTMAVAVASVRRIQERFKYSNFVVLWRDSPANFYATAGQSEIIASLVAPILVILFVSLGLGRGGDGEREREREGDRGGGEISAHQQTHPPSPPRPLPRSSTTGSPLFSKAWRTSTTRRRERRLPRP